MLISDASRDRMFTLTPGGDLGHWLGDARWSRPEGLAPHPSDRRLAVLAPEGLFEIDALRRTVLRASSAAAPGGGGIAWGPAAYGEKIFLGDRSGNRIRRFDNPGFSTLATGINGPEALAFGPGGAWGAALYVADANLTSLGGGNSASDGAGRIVTIDAAGAVTTFVSNAGLLNGVSALAFDTGGAFGGDLFAADVLNERVLRITPGGSISVFATGFANLDGSSCLAFGPDGALVVADHGTGNGQVIRIAAAAYVTDAGPSPGATGGRRGLVFAPPTPNPARDGVRFGFDLADDATDVRLELFDVRGRAVRALGAGPRAAGRHTIAWDGRDTNGARLPGRALLRAPAGRRRRGRAARGPHAVSRGRTFAALVLAMATAVAGRAEPALARDAAVTFVITPPAATPAGATLHVAGDLPALGEWSGRGLVLARTSRRSPQRNARGRRGHVDGLQDHAGRLGDGGEGQAGRGDRQSHAGRPRRHDGRDHGGRVARPGRDAAAPRASTLTGDVRAPCRVRVEVRPGARRARLAAAGLRRRTGRRYPVLYFHDGNNVFDAATSFAGVEWGVDETADRLVRAGHDAAVHRRRGRQHARSDRRIHAGREAAAGRRDAPPTTRRFLIEELKPFIDATLPHRSRAPGRPAWSARRWAASSRCGWASSGRTCSADRRRLAGGLVGRATTSCGASAGKGAGLRIWMDIGTDEGTEQGGRRTWLGDAQGCVTRWSRAAIARAPTSTTRRSQAAVTTRATGRRASTACSSFCWPLRTPHPHRRDEPRARACAARRASRREPAASATAVRDSIPPLALRGVDVSSLARAEEKGAVHRDAQGRPGDALMILRDHGVNAVRLRVWVDPADGADRIESVVPMARRARDLGLDVVIDLHYSDGWADPGTQVKPAAWRDLSFAALTRDVGVETRASRSLRAAGVTPRIVQVGNEINDGFLWPDGRASFSLERTAVLVAAGAAAARAASPASLVMIHVAATDTAAVRWLLDGLAARGVPLGRDRALVLLDVARGSGPPAATSGRCRNPLRAPRRDRRNRRAVHSGERGPART